MGLLQNVTNYFSENNATLEEILRNSGKDYNDLGRYEDCTYEVPGFHYILVTVPRGLPIPVSMGLCVPQVCTIADFNEFKPYMISAVNGLLPELFAGIKGFDVTIQIGEADLHFANSYELNKEVTQADAFEWFTVLVLVMFAVAAVAASFARSYFQRQAA